MEITVVTNGTIENTAVLKSVISQSEYVICADGAAKYLMKLDVTPDLLVGDLDSIHSDALKWMENNQIPIEQFPVKKDMTDTELAVEFALKKSPKKINIVGAIGSRMDHSLGNIMLLYKVYKAGVEARIINEVNEITITDKDLWIEGNIGQTISVIPIGGDVKGITLEGFEYPLRSHSIHMGSSLGISNRFASNRGRILIEQGLVLIIKVNEEQE